MKMTISGAGEEEVIGVLEGTMGGTEPTYEHTASPVE